MGTARPDIILLNISSIHLINNTVHMLQINEKTSEPGAEKPSNPKLIHVNSRISERMERAHKGISTNVFESKYDPMTGIRTGCILGGFLLLIMAYVVYKGRCKDQDDPLAPEEPWVTEYKKRYDDYMKKIEERTSGKKEQNFKKSVRKEVTKVIVVPPPIQEPKSAAIEKTKQWLQDQPFDLEKLECSECKIHARINQFQVIPSHSLSFEDLHHCGIDRDHDPRNKSPSKSGYLAINDISLLRKRPSDLGGTDFCNLLSKESVQDDEGNLVRIHHEPKAADDNDMHTTVDIEMTDLSLDGDNGGYISFSNESAPLQDVVTSSVTSQDQDDPDDSMPLLHQISNPRSMSNDSVKKLSSDEHLSLLDTVHIIPEYPDKPRYSDGVLEFGRLFMNKPGQVAVPQPRKLLDIRDNSKFSLHKSSPDSITCDPLSLTFPDLPFDDSLTSSSGDNPESPSSSEKPASVMSASSVMIYVTPMSSPNYESSQHIPNQGVILKIEADNTEQT